MRKTVFGVALAAVALYGTSAMAQLNTCKTFAGTSFFSPNLTGSPASGPVAFTFTGYLAGCSGPLAGALEGATVSTSNGVIGSGGNCAFALYGVPEFQVCTGPGDPGSFFCDDPNAFATILCTGSIPQNQGIAAAGLATEIPHGVDCSPSGNGNHTAGFILQFLTTSGSAALSACGPGGAGVSDLTFTGFFGSN